MTGLGAFWESTVGQKISVAVSGLLLWAWVVLHLLGNLTVFSGAAATDGYAAALHRAPGWLWAARVALASVAAIHVAGIARLARRARTARPRHATAGRADVATLASRGMRIGGALLLAFVGYHLLHLTFGVGHRGFVPGHVYDNVVTGLRSPWIAGVYVGAAGLVGLHLFHGLWAAVRSLGVRPATAARRHRPAVALIATATAAGFAAVPLAVLAGWLR